MEIANDSPVQFFLSELTNKEKTTIDSFTDTIVLFDKNERNLPIGILFDWDDDSDNEEYRMVIATPFFYHDNILDLYFHSETTEAYFNHTRADVLEFSKIKVLSDILDYFPIELLERYDANGELPYSECLTKYEVADYVQRVLACF